MAKRTSKKASKRRTLQETHSFEPDARAKKIAFWSVLGIVLVMGVVGALIELVLGPLLATPVGANDLATPPRKLYMYAGNGVYEPNTFTVRAGERVEWTIDARDAQNCTEHLIVPDLEIDTVLPADEVTLSFATYEPAIIPFSCATTTAQGYIIVK
jgi:hypothetical protein